MLLYQSRQRQAGVAELADALDSGSSGSNLVEVQVLSPALQAIIQWVVAFFIFWYFFRETANNNSKRIGLQRKTNAAAEILLLRLR